MKLTRRVLAVIVAVAMLAGVMSVGSFAAVGDYDATSNPYTTKIGLKAYRVDDSGEYTEITDGKVRIDIPEPKLWSPESPYLYYLEIETELKHKTVNHHTNDCYNNTANNKTGTYNKWQNYSKR